jgi:hypothetical protein
MRFAACQKINAYTIAIKMMGPPNLPSKLEVGCEATYQFSGE